MSLWQAQGAGAQASHDHRWGGSQHRPAIGMPSRRVVAMKTYRATARREKKWWVVEVPGVGTTQGRTTAEVQRMAADLVAIMKEIPLEDVRVEVEFEVPG